MSGINFSITKHWLFDFDGTLVDSMPYWSSCMISVLDDHNVPHGNDLINIITPLGTAGTIAYFQKLGLEMSYNDIKNEIASKLTPFYLDIIPEKKNVIQSYLMQLEELLMKDMLFLFTINVEKTLITILNI